MSCINFRCPNFDSSFGHHNGLKTHSADVGSIPGIPIFFSGKFDVAEGNQQHYL